MNETEQGLLESWKEIGAYLHRDGRTLRRWEKEEGLPVHRLSHKSRSSVYAYRSELDAWRASRKLVAEPPPPLPLWKSLLAPPRFLAVGMTLALCLLMVGNGVRPQVASAQEPKQVVRQVWTGPEVDYNGSVSADGRYLSFTDWSTGDLDIRDLTTGTNRRLIDSGGWGEKSLGFADRSVISPSGSRIAYAWWIAKEAKWDLRVLPLTGGEPKVPRVLRQSPRSEDGIFPIGWTPDERELLVLRYLSDNMSQLGMLTVEDGAYRALKSDWRFNRPRLSPDGRWVAYGGLPDQTSQLYDIYVLSTDGSQEAAVVQNPANDVPMEWSPDGSHLYFVSTRTGDMSLWSVPVQAGKTAGAAELVRQNTGPLYNLGMTRGGAFYYRVAVNGGTNVYDVELGPDGTAVGTPALLSQRLLNTALGARVSPDGKLVAYYSIRKGPEHRVIVRTLESGQERSFQPEARLAYNHGLPVAWFPDSQSLLVPEYDLQKRGISFFRFHIASGEQKVVLHLSKDVESFRLSPDGKTVFYLEAAEQRGSQMVSRLVRYDLDTQLETELSADRWIREIALSPDGEQLAYAVELAGFKRGLELMPSRGGPVKEIFQGSMNPVNALEWTPDQKFLMFAAGSGRNAKNLGSLWRIPAAGGPAVEVGPVHKGGIKGPQVAPDGRRLFFTEEDTAASEVWALENFIPQTAK